jgi:hypothetical protein
MLLKQLNRKILTKLIGYNQTKANLTIHILLKQITEVKEINLALNYHNHNAEAVLA